MKFTPLLAFDTSAAHCAAHFCGMPLLDRYEPMQRGQAERLMPLCEELLQEAGANWQDLRAIAVGTGPGNFTGIRISVSAARGLALALGIPAVGVTGFEVMHAGIGVSGRVMVSLPAPREQAYVQTFVNRAPITAPSILTPGTAPDELRQPNLFVVGWQAEAIACAFDAPFDAEHVSPVEPRLMASTIATVAFWKMSDPAWQADRPSPLYVRPADATPPREAPPAILL